MDLLGFGRSPKPRACLYTLKDHLEMIEESPYFPSSSIDVGTVALERLAGKSLWPPIIWFSCYDLVRALEQVCLFLYLPEPHDMAKDSEAVYSQKDLSWKNSMAALSLRIFVFTIL